MKLSVKQKLLGMSFILIAFTLLSGVLWIATLGMVEDQASRMNENVVDPLEEIGIARAKFNENRNFLSVHIHENTAEKKAEYEKKMADNDATIHEQLDSFATTLVSAEAKQTYENLRTELTAYEEGRVQVVKASYDLDKDGAYKTLGEITRPHVNAIIPLFGELFDSKAALGDSLNAEITSTYETMRLVAIAFMVVSTVIGVVLALVMSNRIVKGVAEVQTILGSLAGKGLTWLVEGMERLRDGDLTYEISPVTPKIERYGSDEIGKTAEYTNEIRDKVFACAYAYNDAMAGLTRTLSEVQEAADSVTRTSEQLNEAASQTGAATQQVATTITQVAGGTAEQARAASETNEAVHELAGVITTVSDGATQTSHAVDRSLDAVSRMQSALTASTQAQGDLKPANERAASALVKVTGAIDETADGMARIKTAVDDSAVKVAELGAKGEQIGAIVETIDDIAEQTNLLALNAAIEAARAGEMGKGFAVVADEVRKLAERSGRATKEIASLIAEVQKGTQDAVSAMQTGAAEVEQGLVVGQRTSESVVEIRDAAKARDAALEKVFGSLKAIADAATDVSASSDDIARIVAQTAAGASRMGAEADQVNRSIQSIAAVSEENSAAAEEVSAATEEMSAQAEEVVASAATLAQMAEQLDQLVARFRLNVDRARDAAVPEEPAGTVVQRRRAADWGRSAA